MLNDSKTEIVHFHSKHRTPSSLPAIVIGDARIDTADSARDLSVTLVRTLQMKNHIRNIARSASFGIYKIGRIRRYLDQPTTERLVHAFVSTRLDCNNSLLCGLPFSHIAPLQRVQNSAARLWQIDTITFCLFWTTYTGWKFKTASVSKPYSLPIRYEMVWLQVPRGTYLGL